MKHALLGFLALFIFASIANSAEGSSASETAALNPHEQIMVGKVWITTNAIDQAGKAISPDDESVAVFFGKAEYFSDHTFKMTTIDGKPKMHGLWSISEDAKERVLTVLDDAGNVRFKRAVENVTVTDGEYTYRIYPNANNKTVYFDIIHKPQ